MPFFSKHTGLHMKYFVLNPNKIDGYGRASRIALTVYAHEIEGDNPDLERDIREWINWLETERPLGDS